MPEYQCRKCNKIWYGWAQTTICPACGGELKKRGETEKKESLKKYIREGVEIIKNS